MHNAIDIAPDSFCVQFTRTWNRVGGHAWYLGGSQVQAAFSHLGFPFERRLSVRLAYIFSYNLFQFCGHTWILTNTAVRFLTFGQGQLEGDTRGQAGVGSQQARRILFVLFSQDALADTFHSVGFVMSLCQLLSVLEIFHIADRLERARLLPRLVQVRAILWGWGVTRSDKSVKVDVLSRFSRRTSS